MIDHPQSGPRSLVTRRPARGVYDRAQIHRILDEAFVCHVGFVVDGQPFVIPTSYARVDDRLYLHGSTASRMVRTLERGIEVCVTATLVDGLVLARSAFHHSVNYRSVVVFGTARLVENDQEKMSALRAFTNHVVPGRWEEVRPPTEQELQGTAVLALTIDEASAKVRTGPPIDDEEDYALAVWAGEVPLRTTAGELRPDDRLVAGVPPFDAGRLARRGALSPAAEPAVGDE